MTDACKYLVSIKEAGERLAFKMKQIQTMEQQIMYLTAPTDQEQVSHTRDVTAMTATIAVIVDMQKEFDRQYKRYLTVRKEALSLLGQIKPVNAILLTERFLEGKSAFDIGKDRDVSVRQAQRCLSSAIAEFQEVYDKNKKSLTTLEERGRKNGKQ